MAGPVAAEAPESGRETGIAKSGIHRIKERLQRHRTCDPIENRDERGGLRTGE